MTGLSMSAFYYKPKVEPHERAKQDADLRDRIERVHAKFPRSGYRTMLRYLKRIEDIKVGERRLRRIMKEYGLLAEIKKAFVRTTDSDHPYPIFRNLLKGHPIDNVDQAWVADITYIRIATCFVYLAVILDLYSRKVIGWAISKHIDQDLTLAALRMAIETRKTAEGCIHHSDRGVQYAAQAYVDLLKENKFQISMSRKGNPYDNAHAESFMKTLKYDEVYLWEYETFADVVERISFFIDDVYNKERIHSSLGYISPVEFEEQKSKEKTASQPITN